MNLDDPALGLTYSGRHMLTDAQILYIEEVLGASVPQFQNSPEVLAPQPTVAILTPPLTEPEAGLLAKILSSIGLREYAHLQENDGIPAQIRHVFDFGGPAGRRIIDHAVHWGLPSLASMSGPDGEVAARKKEAWALLQQFQREKA